MEFCAKHEKAFNAALKKAGRKGDDERAAAEFAVADRAMRASGPIALAPGVCPICRIEEAGEKAKDALEHAAAAEVPEPTFELPEGMV